MATTITAVRTIGIAISARLDHAAALLDASHDLGISRLWDFRPCSISLLGAAYCLHADGATRVGETVWLRECVL